MSEPVKLQVAASCVDCGHVIRASTIAMVRDGLPYEARCVICGGKLQNVREKPEVRP